MRSDVGGNDVTEYIRGEIEKRNHKVSFEEVESIKMALGRVAADYDSEIAAAKASGKPLSTAFLADGRQFPVYTEILSGPEILFTPSILMKETPGLPELVKKAINQCDLDVRKDLWEHIYFAGGSTLFPGLPSKLKAGLETLKPENTEVILHEVPQRLSNTFAGASAIAMFEEFYDWCVTVDEYDGEGDEIFSVKCVS
eukprot:TRINITY_DN974_c0_g1_i1.p1 TRINITY_DN974_c0_g1~~TRINITY_DN974_c0_g1_i1.p1  ORF type:complete len:198 (-),score=42.47 TRINITY_DN974_c0_g1_i1:105-698(-)